MERKRWGGDDLVRGPHTASVRKFTTLRTSDYQYLANLLLTLNSGRLPAD